MVDRKRQVVNEIHAPARRNYTRRHVITKGIDDLIQADLVEMQPYASVNSGHKYLLTVIDTFSKYAWARAVKRKTGEDVTAAMKSILDEGRIPTHLQTDLGKEFYNSTFQRLMREHNIKHYSTYSNLKASICERFNRTLKGMMWREFSYNGSYKWLDMLPKLIAEYNGRRHRTIGMAPRAVTRRNESQILENVYGRLKRIDPRAMKFKVGDHVRVSRMKGVFEKGFTPNWSTELFTIDKVAHTNPTTYRLKDVKNSPIEGGFYEYELQRAKYNDVYLVEKILRRRGSQVYVKWLGFDKSHNSWISETDIL